MDEKLNGTCVLNKWSISSDTHAFRYRPDIWKEFSGQMRNFSIEEISNSLIWHAAIGSLNDPFEVYAKSNRNELKELTQDEWFKLWVKCFAQHTLPYPYWRIFSSGTVREIFQDNILAEKEFMLRRFKEHDFFGEFIKEFRDTVAIASFTKKPDSRLMWGYYCNGMNGFCIIYNRERLINSCIRLDEVEYGDAGLEISAMDHAYSYRTKRDDTLLIKIPKFKHKEWHHESELRSLCLLEGGDVGLGKTLQLNECCIDGVIIGSKVCTATKAQLLELSRKLNFRLYYAEANLEKFAVDISDYPK